MGVLPAHRLPVVRIAVRNLGRNRLRTGLAALGIVIGVMAIATLGILGTVLQLSATSAFGGVGTQVVVTPGGSGGAGDGSSLDSLSAVTGGGDTEGFSPRDVQRIRRIGEKHGTVVPMVTAAGTVSRGQSEQIGVLAGTDNPQALFSASDGRIPRNHRQGALVGHDLAENLGLRVGSTVEIDGNSYRVLALLEEGSQFLPIATGNALVLPEGEFTEPYSQIIVRTESQEQAAAVAGELRSAFDGRGNRITVVELSSLLDQIREYFGLLNAVLLAIGSISLVVAGVSIVNVMLMSTSERSEELGMLRAVGVGRTTVMRMVVAEALLLGVLGGLAGAMLSLLAGVGLSVVTPVSLELVLHPRNVAFLLLAFCFGVGTSLLSGLYPAWKTANRRPVEALNG
ncbi:ABC transporter permease [Halorientalis sp.]|uniref:ABC transporter permease n=1 Tax=Halorientalis sp. TaxID=1931229 RepID=UPI002602F9A3|nr:ABC transporter permease [Halorientalis sp.]